LAKAGAIDKIAFMDGPDSNDIDELVAEDLRKIEEEAARMTSSQRSDRMNFFMHPKSERSSCGTQGKFDRHGMSFSDLCAKQQRALQTLKKGGRSTRSMRSLGDLHHWRQMSEPAPGGTNFGTIGMTREATEESLCSDEGDVYACSLRSAPEGHFAISMVQSVAQQHSRAHEACLVALTELRRDADLHCKELKKVLKLQGHEIEVLRRRRSFFSCSKIFFAAFGLGLGLAHGLQAGRHVLSLHGSGSCRHAFGICR